MLRLVSVFVDIAFHRRGPDALPASTFLLGLTVAAYVAVFLLTLRLAVNPPLVVVVAHTINTVLGVLLTWSLLRAFARERRLKQTITALFGTGVLLNVLVLPTLLWARSLEQSGSETTAAEVLLTVLVVWDIDITGFVFSRAIERPYLLGLAFAIGFWLLLEALRASMFPPVAV